MKPYFSQRKIKVKMEMTPDKINQHWQTHLFSQICHKFQGKCTREDGYILHIKKIVKIHDHFITIHGMGLFFVEVLAKCILPKIGDYMEVVIDMIFNHGVFCHHQMLRMMMPSSKCSIPIRQEFSTNSLYDPSSRRIIRKGDVITVRIEDVRFENDLYSCIVSFQNDLKT